MENIGEKQKVRPWAGVSRRVLATGLLGAAGIAAALLFTAGEAEARPITVPGIGEFEIAEEIAIPLGIPAATPSPAVSEVPATESVVVQTFEFRPVTIPMAQPIPAPLRLEPTIVVADIAPIAASAPAPSDSRSVVIAGLGTFFVPNSIPALTGIPGLSDSAAASGPLPAAMPAKSAGVRAVEAARTKLGANYRSGAVGPDAFDCSGLVQWSYREAGVELPRTSYSQLSAGTPVSMDELEPGDLVSYYGGGHSALYAGDGQVIHAASYGQGVKMSPVDNMPASGARRF